MAITHKPRMKNTNTLGFILVEEYQGENLVARQTYPRTRENERIVRTMIQDIHVSTNPRLYMRITYLTTKSIENHVPQYPDRDDAPIQ